MELMVIIIYYTISSLYLKTESCVRLNNIYTSWFTSKNGVRQGDTISPTLFLIFINDLAVKSKETNIGIPINDGKVSLLLYADDVVLLTETENDMQVLHWTYFIIGV